MVNQTNNSNSLWQCIVLTTLSAVLAAISFAPMNLSLLAWLALVPWLYGLTKWNHRLMFLSVAVFDVVYFGIGISWMATVHILSPIAILVPLYVMILPFPALFWWSYRYSKWPILLVIPVLWVGTDLWRGFLFTGFPWLYLSHSQAWQTWLIQIADVTGAHGVTFLVMLVNALLLECSLAINKQLPLKNVVRDFAIVAVVLAVVAGYGHYRLEHLDFPRGPKIASIQGNVPQDIKNDPQESRRHIMRAYTTLTQQALQHDLDMLIWPETMTPRPLLQDPQTWQTCYDIASHHNLPFLIGSHYSEVPPGELITKEYNSGFLMSPEGEIVDRYDKIRLVPVGEAIPFGNVLPLIPMLVKTMVGYVPNLERGTKRPAFPLGEHHFGTLICFDIIFPQESRILAQKGCDFVVNITNEGWFAHSSELEQILAISIYRAVENRIGVLRAGNTGITMSIPPSGKINFDDILMLPIEEYQQSLANFMAKDLAQRTQLAWHHLPQALWQQQISFLTPALQNWDVQWQGKKYKWKDFPGVFINQVPLRPANTTTFYTQYGDVFGWGTFLLTMFILGQWLLWRRGQKKAVQ